MDKIGNIIYAYRKRSKLSQDELADVVNVSSSAVSKWERNISIPDIAVLCKLADFFEISLDQLLGRDSNKDVDIQFSCQQDAEKYYIAMQLLECCIIARSQGLLAVEEYVKTNRESRETFLEFSVSYLLREMGDNSQVEDIKRFLIRYAQNEKDSNLATMIVEVLTLIFTGENEEYLREVLRSFLGRKYAFLIPNEQQSRWKMNREKLIDFYSNIDCKATITDLLDDVVTYNNLTIQSILRCMTSQELSHSLLGTSPQVREVIFRNMSDRMIYFIGEDMINEIISDEEIIYSQKIFLELKKNLSE